ncbi:unnamed protein product, partial [Closterium sp. NIES-53]
MPASKPPSKRSPPLHDSLATCQAVSSLRPAHEEKEEMDAVSANFRQPDGASVVPANGTSNGTASANGAATSGWSGEELIGYEGKGMQQRLRVAVDVDEGTERCYAGDLPPILTITARINATLSPPAHPPPPLPSPLSHPHPSPLPRPKPTSPFFSPSSRSPVLGSFLSTLNLFCAEKYSVRHDLHEFYVYDFMKVGNPFRRSESTGFAISWMRAQEFEPRLPPSQRVKCGSAPRRKVSVLLAPSLSLTPSPSNRRSFIPLIPTPVEAPQKLLALPSLLHPRTHPHHQALGFKTPLHLPFPLPLPSLISPLAANHRVHDFFKSTHFNDGIPIIPGAFDTLRRLSHFTDLVVVTSRQHVIREPTLEWLDNHFPGVFSSVHFGNHFALEGTPRPKSEMCRELGAEVLIDDNPRYAMECAEHGIQVLLFDWLLQYPWSKTAGGGPHHELIER